MGPPLVADVWKRRGVSLLWNADALASICPANRVISLRQFLRLDVGKWMTAEFEPLLVNDGKTLVVAGLEGSIDALAPDEAEQWLREVIFRAMADFQANIGGTEAALILWIADPGRLDHSHGDDTHYWRCGTAYGGQRIPLSRCLFNGGQSDRQPIQANANDDRCIGLYHPSIKS